MSIFKCKLLSIIVAFLLRTIKNKSQNLLETINNGLNFSVILANCNDLIKSDAKHFLEDISKLSNVKFNVIFIDKEKVELDKEQSFYFTDSQEYFKSYLGYENGTCLIIRPDNFIGKIITIDERSDIWREDFCKYFIEDLSIKSKCGLVNSFKN